ncbi:hypothetical protein LAZ40_11175 [Cereibacter sphaeroides]|uniref:hypothetical protein n=1 Tax=Cereibacter sphaeroides TaxID=1063 RepID=UPI001F181BBE|nr:hypothetical protein [Cereibacter sphaeroides]MCE6959614.1 hypothetical protein [Cereibacter sphaeroides]MCE6974526.1 hypothetical protein [Cereibacter sphaeroides]
MSVQNTITGIVTFPVDSNRDVCTPDVADCWAIHACIGTHETYAGTREIDELPGVLAELMTSHPGTENSLVVRWVGEDGKMASVGPASAEDLIDRLMDVVCDETPDDAENTDDHPLEQVRTALDDLGTLLAKDTTPAPGA